MIEESSLIDEKQQSTNESITDIESSTNFSQTLMNLLKGNIGLGVLALPMSVSRAGSIMGPVLVVAIGLVVLHNMVILSESNLLLLKIYRKNRLGLAGTLKYALKPYLNDRPRQHITIFFNSFLILYITGACALYILAASEILYDVTYQAFGDVRIWSAIFMLPVIGMSFISRIDTISIISGCSNVLCLIGLISVICYSVTIVKPPSAYKYVSKISRLLSCVNSLVFAYEGMSTMIPIVNTIDSKNKITKLLIVSNSLTIVLYSSIGWLGYLAFGEDTKPQILLNLPINWYFNTIKIFYAIGLILTSSVIIYCVLTIMMPKILSLRNFSAKQTLIAQSGMKIFMIGTGVSLAVALPVFSHMLDLLGAFFSIPISFIIPPIVYLLTIKNLSNLSRRQWYIRLIINTCIIIVGVAFTCVGIYVTIEELVKSKQ